MNKTIEKTLLEIIKFARIASININIEDLKEKYNNILECHGEEKAIEAVKNTLKQTKEKAKESEKTFWRTVKNEVFSKYKNCPCSIRDLKEMIKTNKIDITGFENENKIKELLSI
jgi:FtsZ-binding cell division protein ZapB